jgi:hypothetical protein
MYKLQSPASQKMRDHEVTYEERRILESEKFDSNPITGILACEVSIKE